MCFPFTTLPSLDWRGGRGFGADRGKDQKGRLHKHAACDLFMPEGTEIRAVQEGRIYLGPYKFYKNVYALEVKHRDFIVRYGEMQGKLPSGLGVGSIVEEGDVIAYVGKMDQDAMLHFEMYEGPAMSALTIDSPPWFRRGDLMNPTEYLDEWAQELRGSANEE